MWVGSDPDDLPHAGSCQRCQHERLAREIGKRCQPPRGFIPETPLALPSLSSMGPALLERPESSDSGTIGGRWLVHAGGEIAGSLRCRSPQLPRRQTDSRAALFRARHSLVPAPGAQANPAVVATIAFKAGAVLERLNCCDVLSRGFPQFPHSSTLNAGCHLNSNCAVVHKSHYQTSTKHTNKCLPHAS